MSAPILQSIEDAKTRIAALQSQTQDLQDQQQAHLQFVDNIRPIRERLEKLSEEMSGAQQGLANAVRQLAQGQVSEIPDEQTMLMLRVLQKLETGDALLAQTAQIQTLQQRMRPLRAQALQKRALLQQAVLLLEQERENLRKTKESTGKLGVMVEVVKANVL